MKTQTAIASRVSDKDILYLSSAVAIWRPSAVRRNWPGVAVATAIALSASFISMNYGGPQLLYALFLAWHFISCPRIRRASPESSSAARYC
ncbi:hypothetical protein ACFQAT_07465 [Undibacterium arcticum]|uniref:hypothetical protein n=1 Tax=Undibacterium arcticum TaxID=1762892 RepID=UPI0036230CDE